MTYRVNSLSVNRHLGYRVPAGFTLPIKCSRPYPPSPRREASRLDQRPVVDSPTPFGGDKLGGRGLATSVAIAKLVDQNGPLRGK